MIIRFIKIFISILYIFFKKVLFFILRTPDDKQYVILYYHSVLENEKERFISQLSYLSNKYSFINLSSFNTLPSKKNLISITFDDGLSSILKNVIPELKKREIPTTIFIPAAKIGEYPMWEQKDQEIFYQDRILDREEIKKLSVQGIEIGSHTLHHSDLKNVNLEIAKEELKLSKSFLEEITGKDVVSFSFPYGSYNDNLVNLAFDCGYEYVYTTQPEIISLPTKRRVFGRVSVEPNDLFLEFRLKAAGAYSWLPRAIRLKRKIKKIFRLNK